MSIALEELAHEKSSEKRRELLNSITTMFLAGAENHTDRESALYAEVALQVLDDVGTTSRAEFSDTIAHETAMPGAVMKRLATDEIDVASPVLERSPVLTDEDLVEVVETATQEHMHAISHRETLSEQVTDTLVERGDRKVVCAVTVNPGARFSDNGLSVITQRSADDEEMRSHLLRRVDLRSQLVEKVLPMIGGDYAANLRDVIENADDEVIDQVLDDTQLAMEEERQNSARRSLETRMMVKEIRSGSKHVDDAIVYLADQARISDIVTILGKLTDIADNLVSNVLFKPDNEPVAILLRAVGASQVGFKAVQDLRAKKLRLPHSHIEHGMRNFAEIDEPTAKRSLRFVKVRSEVA